MVTLFLTHWLYARLSCTIC